MRIRLVSVGRDRSGLFAPAVEEYAGRIRRHCPFELVELKEAPTPEREGAAIIEALRAREVLVCLDGRGRELSSEELAARLGRWRDEARDVAFAIGGDEGHGEAVPRRADLVWSLGRLTLPHRLARVLVSEQIYRAFAILRGEPYHR